MLASIGKKQTKNGLPNTGREKAVSRECRGMASEPVWKWLADKPETLKNVKSSKLS